MDPHPTDLEPAKTESAAEPLGAPGIRQQKQSEKVGRAYAEALIDTLREGLLVLDNSLRVETANPSFYRMFQVTEQETLGKLVFEIGDGEWASSALRELLEDILPKDKVVTGFELTYNFKGSSRTLSLNARQVDHVQRILLTLEDVTEQRRSEHAERVKSEQLYRAIAANLPGGAAFVVDRDLRYRLAAGEALAGAGLTPADLEGRPLHEVVEKGLAPTYESLYQQALSGQSFRWEHSVQGRYYMSHGTPLRDEAGAVYAALAVSYDITERKQAERQLRELNEMLETRVQARTREVRGLASQLTLAESRERNRLAQVLHDELQQQLHALQFPLSSLQKTVQDEASRAQVERAYTVLKDAIRIVRAVTSELSPPVPGDKGFGAALRWLCDSVQERFGLVVTLRVDEAADALDTTDILDTTAATTADATTSGATGEALRTLLLTLVRECLFNVTKHAGVGAAEVCLSKTAEGLELTVSDLGRGFEPDGLRGGSGLGLQSADQRLRLFGGEVRLESAPGKGTRVKMVVPATALGSA